MQVDPIKPMLKAPGTNLLTLNNDNLFQLVFQFQVAKLQQGRGPQDQEAESAGPRVDAAEPGPPGRAVHVDPIKSKLTAPGTILET